MRRIPGPSRPGRALAVACLASVAVHVAVGAAFYVGTVPAPPAPPSEPIRIVIVRPEPRISTSEPSVDTPMEDATTVRAPIARRQAAEHATVTPERTPVDSTNEPMPTDVTESRRAPIVPVATEVLPELDDLSIELPRDRHEDRPARVVRLMQPAYPATSVRREEQGDVLLAVEVLPDGSPGRIEVEESSGHARLDRAAITAASKSEFEPASRDGVTSPTTILVPFEFRIR